MQSAGSKVSMKVAVNLICQFSSNIVSLSEHLLRCTYTNSRVANRIYLSGESYIVPLKFNAQVYEQSNIHTCMNKLTTTLSAVY